MCRASNIAGHSEVDLTLRVLVPPRIDKSNLVNNPLAILGKEIFLECPASGIPQPEISWRRENSTLTGQEEGFVIREVIGSLLATHFDHSNLGQPVSRDQGRHIVASGKVFVRG